MNNKKKENSPLKLYNTMTCNKKPFTTRKDKNVKMLTCGPSIYRNVHIGNHRIFLFEDILIRYLELLGYKVERVLNFNNVEDKAVDEAKKEGIDINKLAENVVKRFYEESSILRLKPPKYIPKSTDIAEHSIKLIKELLKKEIAYWYEDNIYYDPVKFNGFGKLYGIDMSLWPKKKKRFAKDFYPGMRWNIGDFILWHGCEDGKNICWDEELGSGRPSWNIQGPAIATKYLGYKIDICCGEVDKLYRHHDYNLAIIEGVSGEEFATFWLHCAQLFIYGKKITESTGNIIYLDDLLKDGCTPEHVRFYLFYGHYRNKLNFTRKNFKQTVKKLDELRAFVSELTDIYTCSSRSDAMCKKYITKLLPNFKESMNNDLDIQYAINDLFEVITKLTKFKKEGKFSKNDSKHVTKELKKIDSVLQVIYS